MKPRSPAAVPPNRKLRSLGDISHDAYAIDPEVAADLPPVVNRWRMAHLEDDPSFRHQVLRSAGLVP